MQFPNTPTDCTCPFCGHNVKIEPVSADYYRHPTLPVLYVAKCTECEARSLAASTEERALAAFAAHHFTPETVMLNSAPLDPVTIDEDGVVRLLQEHLDRLGQEYRTKCRLYAELKDKTDAVSLKELGAVKAELHSLEAGMNDSVAKRIRRMALEEAETGGDVFVEVRPNKSHAFAVLTFLGDSWKPHATAKQQIRLGVNKAGKLKIYGGRCSALPMKPSHGNMKVRTCRQAVVEWAREHQGMRHIVREKKGGFYID